MINLHRTKIIIIGSIAVVAYWFFVVVNAIGLRYIHCSSSVVECAKISEMAINRSNNYLVQSGIIFISVVAIALIVIFLRRR